VVVDFADFAVVDAVVAVGGRLAAAAAGADIGIGAAAGVAMPEPEPELGPERRQMSECAAQGSRAPVSLLRARRKHGYDCLTKELVGHSRKRCNPVEVVADGSIEWVAGTEAAAAAAAVAGCNSDGPRLMEQNRRSRRGTSD